MKLLAAASTALFVVAAASAGLPWWGAALLWLAPDAGLATAAADRWRLYNALHALPGPALAGAAALAGIIPAVLALAWLCHVLVDRALGYGLRTREGLQRG